MMEPVGRVQRYVGTSFMAVAFGLVAPSAWLTMAAVLCFLVGFNLATEKF